MEIDPQVQRMFPFSSWLKLNCKKYYTVSDKKDVERDFPSSAVAAVQFSSVQFSRSVVSDSLRPHESQHARPPCPSPTPGVHSDSRPSSQ